MPNKENAKAENDSKLVNPNSIPTTSDEEKAKAETAEYDSKLERFMAQVTMSLASLHLDVHNILLQLGDMEQRKAGTVIERLKAGKEAITPSPSGVEGEVPDLDNLVAVYEHVLHYTERQIKNCESAVHIYELGAAMEEIGERLSGNKAVLDTNLDSAKNRNTECKEQLKHAREMAAEARQMRKAREEKPNKQKPRK